MVSALYPEDLLMQMLLARIGRMAPFQGQLPALPRRLPISPEFAKSYQRLARGLIVEALGQTLGLQSFQLQADGSTVSVRLSEPAFWRDLQPRLSRAGLEWLWWSFCHGARPAQEPTPWDALLLQVLLLRQNERFDLAWMLEQQADWPVLAWAMLRLDAQPGRIDLLVRLWDAAASLAYPLRFLLIELSAAWLCEQTAFCQQLLEGGDFGMADYRQLLEWAQRAHTDTMLAAVGRWQGEGMLGYDDDLWIG
ncbi:MAG TPA: hypothetical protein V6D23_13330, partial [Candidatus Obscuribacterales bacterium]